MKAFSCLALVTSTLMVALTSSAYAESTVPLTRAEVRAEMIQLEQAGYAPGGGENPHYPRDIMAAEGKIANQNRHESSNGDVGGTAGALSSGGVGRSSGSNPGCSASASFCNTYFGN